MLSIRVPIVYPTRFSIWQICEDCVRFMLLLLSLLYTLVVLYYWMLPDFSYNFAVCYTHVTALLVAQLRCVCVCVCALLFVNVGR